jgi:prevent-host-death family protein
MLHNVPMKEAGIREARQNLTALIEEVRKGHEVIITDRGRPVARLIAPRRRQAKPFAGRAGFRRKMPVLSVSLTAAVMDERAERG